MTHCRDLYITTLLSLFLISNNRSILVNRTKEQIIIIGEARLWPENINIPIVL